jgi:hypothetical protein
LGHEGFNNVSTTDTGINRGGIISPNNKYDIFVLPGTQEEINFLCCSVIGQGATFCVRKGCVIKHQGKLKLSVKPGEIFVEKSPGVVFREPSTHTLNITNE